MKNLIDVRYAMSQLRGIVIGNAATHDRVRRALDALERVEASLSQEEQDDVTESETEPPQGHV